MVCELHVNIAVFKKNMLFDSVVYTFYSLCYLE